MTSFAQLVQLRPRFMRSVSLEQDFGTPNALAGYVVSPLARDATVRVVRSLADPEGPRCWSLVGPYGGGKSSLITFLSMLLGSAEHSERARAALLQQHPDLNGLLAQIDRAGPLLPVLVTGERASLSVALLRGAVRASDGFWTRRKPDVVAAMRSALERLEAGEVVSDSDVADMLVELATKVEQASGLEGRGIFLVVDELGKLLEWAAQNRAESDVYLLQLIAERASRLRTARFGILTVLHQEVEAYAEGLSRATRAEWSKVSGRFEQVPYLESPRHAVRLISRALDARPEATESSTYQALVALAHRAADLVSALGDGLTEDLEACFPLNPLTALCLSPLFRTGLAQNERSLFAFLGSGEPHGLRWFLRAHEDQPRLYRLDDLYDYVLANVGMRSATATGERVWAAAEVGLARLPGDTRPLDAQLVKAIALLSIVGGQVGLKCDLGTLQLAVGSSPAELEGALGRLAAASVIVYRKFRDAYRIWDGSDLDVPALLRSARQRVIAQGDLAARLQRDFTPFPIVASEHYFRTGTLRYLTPFYVRETVAPAMPKGRPTGDGDLFLVVPEQFGLFGDEDANPPAIEGRGGRPAIVALPARGHELVAAAVECFAVRDVLDGTPELENDPVARRELNELLLQAEDDLADSLARAYSGHGDDAELRWFFRGEKVAGAGRPSTMASTIFDRVYSKSPPIRNELLNRAQPSSQAAAGRRELMERMFSAPDQEHLGIEGHPPELSMYLSVLEANGLHRAEHGSYGMAAPRPRQNAAMHSVWSHVGSMIRSAGGRRLTVKHIVTDLERPPFGLRAAVGHVVLLAYYIVNRESVFLYEDNTFLPRPGDDIVQRWLKRPESIELQHAAADGAMTTLIDTFARVAPDFVRGETSAMSIARAVVREIRQLSVYADQTSEVSKEAKRVRGVVKSARDPVRLLLSSLPEALGIPDGLPDDAPEARPIFERFVRDLIAALAELRRADGALEDAIDKILRRLLGDMPKEPRAYEQLAARAQGLVDSKQALPPGVNRLADLTTVLASYSEDAFSTWLGGVAIAVTGKPHQHWTDEDLTRFRLGAQSLCRSFLAAESLAIELREHRGSGHPLVRVSLLDSKGTERSRVVAMTADNRERLDAFRTDLLKLAKKRGISSAEQAYAAIVSLMELADELEDA